MGGVKLKQVEKFKYLGVAFTSDGTQDEEMNIRISRAGAVMHALHRSVVMKRERLRRQNLLYFAPSLFPFSPMVMSLG